MELFKFIHHEDEPEKPAHLQGMERNAYVPAIIDELTVHIAQTFGNQKLAKMFEIGMKNTLLTTFYIEDGGKSFVITGDIPAMWLRDSTTQLRPFLLLLKKLNDKNFDQKFHDLIVGVIRKQTQLIAKDPYANAFNASAVGAGHSNDDLCQNPWVWEEKYEIDSLAYPMQLAYQVWKITGDDSFFDEQFRHNCYRILKQWTIEQNHEEQSKYRFIRQTNNPLETLPRAGKGKMVNTTGMTWSGFRPSDDACTYNYNIPANLFAAQVLNYIQEIAQEVFQDSDLLEYAQKLGQDIRQGVDQYGTIEHPKFGRMYAYEVDGFGQYLLIDDGNMPSLMSLPLTGGISVHDEVYKNTREFILSEYNPFYYVGTAARGIGSPHTPNEYIWPIALSVQGITATDKKEKLAIIQTLLNTDAGTNMMHESFHKDDPTLYTRHWFSWANSMFCELLLQQIGCTSEYLYKDK
ncbi:MAG: glycoside hydrolase family 125 protein [Micrococcaceae bacterium]